MARSRAGLERLRRERARLPPASEGKTEEAEVGTELITGPRRIYGRTKHVSESEQPRTILTEQEPSPAFNVGGGATGLEALGCTSCELWRIRSDSTLTGATITITLTTQSCDVKDSRNQEITTIRNAENRTSINKQINNSRNR